MPRKRKPVDPALLVDDPVLSVPEACADLGDIDRKTLWRLKLPKVRLGTGKVRPRIGYRRSVLNAYKEGARLVQ